MILATFLASSSLPADVEVAQCTSGSDGTSSLKISASQNDGSGRVVSQIVNLDAEQLATPDGGFSFPPQLCGAAVVGVSLKVAARVITRAAAELSFAWRRDGALIDGATEPSYVPIAEDEGHALSVEVTARLGDGTDHRAESAAAVVRYPSPSANPISETWQLRPADGPQSLDMPQYFSGTMGGSWAVTAGFAEISPNGLLTVDPAQFSGQRSITISYENSNGRAETELVVERLAPVHWNTTRIRGININPTEGGWANEELGLTAQRRAALQFAGYNALRVWIDPQDILDAPTDTARQVAVDAAIAKIQNGVDDGFRVNAQIGPSHAVRTDFAAGNGVDAYATAAAALAEGIAAAFPNGLVMLDLMNEPFDGTADYESNIADVWDAARAVAPDLTLAVEPRSLAYAPNIADLDAARFDDNTIFAIHGYDPGLLTHQQNYPGLPQIPYPVSLYAGGLAKAISDMEAIVNADSSLNASEKSARIAARTADLEYLFFDGGIDRSFIAGLLDPVDAWLSTNGLDQNQVLLNEFGFIGEHQWSGNYSYDDVDSRARYMRDWRLEVEERGYGGWLAYQALGDFEMFEQTDVLTAGTRLIPEISEGLGMTMPEPPMIGDLAVASSEAGAIQLTFSDVADATYYEYALDGGPWLTLGVDQKIVGLEAETTYEITVRGANATTAGPAASVSGTTVALPGWVAAYGDPRVVADFLQDRYWVEGTQTADLSSVLTIQRDSARFALGSAGIWRRFDVNEPALTDTGLHIEPAWEGEALHVATHPDTQKAHDNNFPAGLHVLGGSVDPQFTIAAVDDVTAIADSGLAEVVPNGLVWEINNASAATQYIQVRVSDFPVDSTRQQIGSWFARQISGLKGAKLGKNGSNDAEPVRKEAKYRRYSVSETSDWQLQITVPAGAVVRFVQIAHEYTVEAMPSSPLPAGTRDGDRATLTQALADAVAAGSEIRVASSTGEYAFSDVSSFAEHMGAFRGSLESLVLDR